MTSESLILFFIVGFILVGGAILFSSFIAPTSTNLQKSEAYECGVPTKGVTWLQFNVGYYLFALLFLVFEVEIVFIIPWAVVMKQIGMVAFIEILIFFAFMGLGLIYAWKKHALIWQ